MIKLSEISLKNIENEIEKFESQVDFEFIPVIAQKSSSTEHVPWILSLVFILFFIGILNIAFEHFLYDAWYDKTFFYLVAVALSIVLSRILSRFNFIQRQFISEHERQNQAHQRAQSVFFTQRLNEIKSQNALLVFVSIMERRIEILPDPRIKMTNVRQMTDHAVGLLKAAFKDQKYEQGFIEVIHYMQQQLHEKFPRTEPEENQVSNKLIWV